MLVPLKLLLAGSEVGVDLGRRERAEAALVEVLNKLAPFPRGVIQRGLLRANAVLVGAYVAPEHRACPLASAVWETTGIEPSSMYQVQMGLPQLGLSHDEMSTFVSAFDEWAAAWGFVRQEADGSTVLTYIGRSVLLRMFEDMSQPASTAVVPS